MLVNGFEGGAGARGGVMWCACIRVQPPHPQPLSPKGGEGRKKEFRLVGRGEREGILDGGARGERRISMLGVLALFDLKAFAVGAGEETLGLGIVGDGFEVGVPGDCAIQTGGDAG